jgi:hypothetical protein
MFYLYEFMMKNVLISMIAVFYLAVTSGVVLNIHYCMGRISSVTFNHDKDHEDGACGKCGMNKTEHHCCGDVVKMVKLSDSHQASNFSFELVSISALLPNHETVLHQPEQGVSPAPSTDYFSPPPKTLNKVYRDINVFLI